MTDRVHALTVILDRDMRTDDVETVTNAIRCLRFVASVEEHVTDLSEHSARERIRHEMQMQLWDLVPLLFKRDPDLVALLNRKREGRRL
jgi:hypothetical protein